MIYIAGTYLVDPFVRKILKLIKNNADAFGKLLDCYLRRFI